jgi:L-cysteine desulfidase
MTVQYVVGDVGPKLAEDIREGVTRNGVSVFLRERSKSAVCAGIIGGRDTLRNASAENLRGIEAVMPVVVGCDEDARGSIDTSLPKSALALSVVTLASVHSASAEVIPTKTNAE